MNNIILITGMAGSGKTTIGRLVAKFFSKSLLLQVDQLREMMVNGVVMPNNGLTEATNQQFQMARSTAIYMAILYASQGVDVVIDDVSFPANFVEQYAALFGIPGIHRVLLYPNAPALIERIKKRAGPWDHLLVALVPKIYSYLEPMPKDDWIVLDSSEWTIRQTVHAVLSNIGAITAKLPSSIH